VGLATGVGGLAGNDSWPIRRDPLTSPSSHHVPDSHLDFQLREDSNRPRYRGGVVAYEGHNEITRLESR